MSSELNEERTGELTGELTEDALETYDSEGHGSVCLRELDVHALVADVLSHAMGAETPRETVARLANSQNVDWYRFNDIDNDLRRVTAERGASDAACRLARVERWLSVQLGCWGETRHPENTEREHWLVRSLLRAVTRAVHGPEAAECIRIEPLKERHPRIASLGGVDCGSVTDDTSRESDGAATNTTVGSGPTPAPSTSAGVTTSAAPADASGASEEELALVAWEAEAVWVRAWLGKPIGDGPKYDEAQRGRMRAIASAVATRVREQIAAEIECIVDGRIPSRVLPLVAKHVRGASGRDAWDAMVARAEQAERERDEARADVVEAAGELLVDVPKPGTDEARIMLANMAMRRERNTAREERDTARTLARKRARRVNRLLRRLRERDGLHARIVATRDEMIATLREVLTHIERTAAFVPGARGIAGSARAALAHDGTAKGKGEGR